MIQHPLSGMHVVLIKTAVTILYKNDPNADPAEADYVIKAGLPETN